MKYKERIVATVITTLLVLATFVIYNNDTTRKSLSLLEDGGQCHAHNYYMTADWTVESIYNDLNFIVNKSNGLYYVIEKPDFKKTTTLFFEPLKIIVVPHSHNDPGWLWTFEDYYTIRTRQILTNTVIALKSFPDFRMIWTETVFLERWWKESSESLRSDFRNLVKSGKIEILSGGWVSVDEATTHYTAVLDQLIEGHLWLKEHLGVYPNISWSIDPFGYSASLPYLWKEAGMKNMAILRIHGAVKGYMGNRKMLTYQWRQPWDTNGDHDIHCHVEPYTLYNIECSCGPDTEICRVLDFSSVGSFPDDDRIIYFGENRKAKNFEEFAGLVVEQYKTKASLYNHNVILMPHGDDFRYIEDYDISLNYKNMKRLMDYVNSRKDWNVKMKFGTVADYFEILHSEMRKSKTKDSSLTGDFFTYTDKDNEYWSGYFTTRPFDKRMIRELLEYLKTTETMASLIFVYLIQNKHVTPSDWKNDWKAIQLARRTHGLVQHHDAITGTSTASTVMDFEVRIHEAIRALMDVLKKHITKVLMSGSNANVPELKITREFPSPTNLFEDKIITCSSGETYLVFINSYSKRRREVTRVYVDTYDIEVFDSKDNVVHYQVSPIWSQHNSISNHGFEIYFEINIAAIGLSVYTIRRKPLIVGHRVKANRKQTSIIANISSFKGEIKNAKNGIFTPKSELLKSSTNGIFSIENQYLKLSFLKVNGGLQTICLKSTPPYCIQVQIDFFRYYGNNSNAYCFNSNGEQDDLTTNIKMVTLSTGSHMSQVKVYHKLFSHIVTLYNTNSVQGRTVHIENIATVLSPEDRDTELMMRLNTNIQNQDTRYFTDSNGFQMMSRKLRTSLPIGANFYPFTTMAIIEDLNKRLTLHTAQPLGIGSFSQGSLEIMLDRVPMSTGKGLDESVTDNKPAISKFIIHIERLDGRHIDYRKYQVHPSITSHMINDLLQNPIVSLYSVASTKFSNKELTFYEHNSLPCSVYIANFRSMLTESGEFRGTGLTLHKRLTSCNIEEHTDDICSDSDEINLQSMFKHLELNDIKQMSLSHLHEMKSDVKRRNNIIKNMELESYLFRWRL